MESSLLFPTSSSLLVGEEWETTELLNSNSSWINPLVAQTPEYKKVVAYLDLLNGKRLRVVKEIEQLKKTKAIALADPQTWVENFVNQRAPRLPVWQFIPQVPHVDLNKYASGTTQLPEPVTQSSVSEIANANTASVLSPQIQPASLPLSPTAVPHSPDPLKVKVESSNVTLPESIVPVAQEKVKKTRKKVSSVSKETVPKEEPVPGIKVRGRVYTPEKPVSFNRLWNDEEQQRLEDLLQKFPEEEIAAHRWSKIAKALGNRTPKQVASRVQKYFIKLAKGGKPVPGKIPNFENYTKKAKKDPSEGEFKPEENSEEGLVDTSKDELKYEETKLKPKQAKRKVGAGYYEPPPVYMSDDDESIDTEHNINETQITKRTNNERIVAAGSTHEGIQCDGCKMKPIMGVRWSCTVCVGLDLCGSCSIANKYSSQLHERDHKLYKIDVESLPYYLDESYRNRQYSTESNYLDPLFMAS